LQGERELDLIGVRIIERIGGHWRLLFLRYRRNDARCFLGCHGVGRKLGEPLLLSAGRLRLATRVLSLLQCSEPIRLGSSHPILRALGFGARLGLGTLQICGALLFFLPAQRIGLAQFLRLFGLGGDARRRR
jgi:hypothetical protein